ncbi:MAG: hypothetical protein PHC92_07065 [Syntrophomonadaceae bacterium]|nr:hypothetical protein [Syntrophomonadaceae bacterium]MDD3023798.1 hypothetical protein [Syntrophomonadaceae bacterium]
MFDLDFAFYNLKNTDRRGIFCQKFILDRLAPVFFGPRVERLIDLQDLGSRGCNITLPLGPGNLKMLEPQNRENIVNKSKAILEEYNLPAMAVDRRHKKQFSELFNQLPLVFGDNFIKALASVMIRETLSRRNINKLVVVGDTEYFADFICEISNLGIPVSLQSHNPCRQEVMAYRLLYEKGHAVSTSYIKPQHWQRGDLILMFDPDQQQLAITYPQAFYIKLSNEVCNLALELENRLQKNGIDYLLHNLAPILEISLLSKAGIWGSDAEQNNAREGEGQRFLVLQKIGYELGLWDLFLDKAI